MAETKIENMDPKGRYTISEIAEIDPRIANAVREYMADQLSGDGREKPDPWQVFTLADAYQERPPVEYVAAGLFALPSLNIVYGSPGTLKSFLLADLVTCVAAGEEWLTPAPWITNNLAKGIATTRYPAMWLDFDNGRRRTHDRFGALGRARDLPEDTSLYYYSMPSPWLNASDKASIGHLSIRIQNRDVKLVIIDNLGVISGDVEENSAEMGHVMSFFRQIAEETGAAIVLIHHQRKSTGMGGRAGDALRGHSSIEASLDLALMIEREDYSDTANIKATKFRGEDVLPFSAAFTFSNKPDGELDQARFFGIATIDTKSNAAIEQAILEALSGESMNKGELTKAVRELLEDESGKAPGLNRVRDMIDRMAALNKISQTTGDRGAKIYRRL